MSGSKLILVVILVGCGNKDALPAGTGSAVLADYLRMKDGESWVFRVDDGSTAPADASAPAESELIRARFHEGGTLGFRQGTRWADATPWGELVFDLDDGIDLTSWDFGGATGSGLYRLADDAPAHGDRHGKGEWRCLTDRSETVETFYGFFDDVVQLQCESGDGKGLPGVWSFGHIVGLVRIETERVTLDLVAPH